MTINRIIHSQAGVGYLLLQRNQRLAENTA